MLALLRRSSREPEFREWLCSSETVAFSDRATAITNAVSKQLRLLDLSGSVAQRQACVSIGLSHIPQ